MDEDVVSTLRQKQAQQFAKTEMCKFFLANRCSKGSRCQYAHSASEIREKPDLNRTSMCFTFLNTGSCDTPNCTYAHDERELRVTAAFFKTKLCRFAGSGRCKHGSKCRFAHTQEELALDPDQGQSKDRQLQYATVQGDGTGPLSPQPGWQGLQTEDEDSQGSYMGNFAMQAGQGADLVTDSGSNNGGSQHSDMGNGANGARYNQSNPGDMSSSQGGMSSNQSTRADRSVSVSTPEGSGGDSGQEELSRQRGTGVRRSVGRVRDRHCTTIMISNVPNFLTQGALVSLLEDLTQCMRGAFDFFYCPWDPHHDCNLGYAIINFFERGAAAEFERQWTNQPLLPKSHCPRRLRIVPASLQGRAANIRHFSGFSLAHHEDPRFRPLVRASPQEALKPMIVSSELRQPQNQLPQPQADPDMMSSYPDERVSTQLSGGEMMYRIGPPTISAMPINGIGPTAMPFYPGGLPMQAAMIAQQPLNPAYALAMYPAQE